MLAAPVFVHKLLLTVPPHARCSLLIIGRVPITVEQDEAVGADKIEATATGCESVRRCKARCVMSCHQVKEGW